MLDVRLGLLPALLAALPQTAAETPEKPAVETADLVFDLRDLRNTRGHVYALVHRSSRGFPGQRSHAVAETQVKVESGPTVVRFTGLPVGEYAVALFHDENGNRTLDTNWLGVPTEGIATSNNAQARVGPPSFRRAKFKLTRSGFRQVLRLRYY